MKRVSFVPSVQAELEMKHQVSWAQSLEDCHQMTFLPMCLQRVQAASVPFLLCSGSCHLAQFLHHWQLISPFPKMCLSDTELSEHTFRILSSQMPAGPPLSANCKYFEDMLSPATSSLVPIFSPWKNTSTTSCPLTSLCKFPNPLLNFVSIPLHASWTVATGFVFQI